MQRVRVLSSFILLWLASLLVGVVPPALGWEREPLSVYHERRARLVGDTGNGAIVLFGYSDADVAASVTRFHQNEAFYYLTGWNEPDAMLLVVPKVAPRSRHDQPAEIDKEILFIPPHDYRAEKWNGPKLGPEDSDAAARTGFTIVKSTTLFPSELQEVLRQPHCVQVDQGSAQVHEFGLRELCPLRRFQARQGFFLKRLLTRKGRDPVQRPDHACQLGRAATTDRSSQGVGEFVFETGLDCLG